MVAKLRTLLSISVILAIAAANAQSSKYVTADGHFDFAAYMKSLRSDNKAEIKQAKDAYTKFGPKVAIDVFANIEKTSKKISEVNYGFSGVLLDSGEAIKPFVFDALKSKSPCVRYAAVATFGLGVLNFNYMSSDPQEEHAKWLKTDSVRDAIAELYQDESLEVRFLAIRTGAALRDSRAEKAALGIVLDKSVEREARWMGIYDLAVLNSATLTDLATKIPDLLNDPRSYLNMFQIYRFNNPNCYVFLKSLCDAQLYKEDKSKVQMISHALDALVYVYGPDRIEIARKMMGEEFLVIFESATCLLASAGGKSVFPEILDVAKSTDADVREVGILAIGYTRCEEAYVFLTNLVKKGGKDAVNAISSMSNLQDKRTIGFLRPYTKSKDKAISERATSIIEILQDTGG